MLRLKPRTREGLNATSQLDSAMGKFKNNMRLIRGNDRRWWGHDRDATDAFNQQRHSGLSHSMPWTRRTSCCTTDSRRRLPRRSKTPRSTPTR